MGQSDTELEEHFFSFLFVSILKWPRTRWPWAVAAAGSISCNTWPLISPLSFSKFTSPGGGRRDFLPQHTHTHTAAIGRRLCVSLHPAVQCFNVFWYPNTSVSHFWVKFLATGWIDLTQIAVHSIEQTLENILVPKSTGFDFTGRNYSGRKVATRSIRGGRKVLLVLIHLRLNYLS